MRISTVITWLALHFTSSFCIGLKNSTDVVNLVSFFINPVPDANIIAVPNMVSYYMNPKDNDYYLWVGVSLDNWTYWNNSGIDDADTRDSFIKSNIFSSSLIPFNDDNMNPFELTNGTEINTNVHQSGHSYGESVDYNKMCTSPKTKDIMTCWQVSIQNGSYNSHLTNVVCKIFFISTNTFSNEIITTNASFSRNQNYWFIDKILCFNDAYFIPVGNIEEVYATLIDLNGNIIYKHIKLQLNTTNAYPLDFLIAIGDDNFNKNINENATSSFILTYWKYDRMTNISNISAAYFYYTNINDKQYPIYIYQAADISNQNNPYVYKGANMETLTWPLAIYLNGNNNNGVSSCCYVSLYTRYNSGQYLNFYGIFTNVFGQHIDIANYNHFQDVLLVKSVCDGDAENNGQMIDLPMVSTEYDHYFMILYYNGTDCQNYETMKIIADIFHFTYDSTTFEYSLEYDGSVDTITSIDGQNDIWEFYAYLMPNTNNLYFLWYQQVGNHSKTTQLAYGQTWTVTNYRKHLTKEKISKN